MTATVRARWTLRTVAQLLILGAVAFCTLNAPDDAFGSSAPTSQSVARTSPVADGAEARFARTALRLTNQARATHDLPPLRLQPCLAEVAQDWAATLAEQARLTEQDLGPVADACGTSAGTGANVATGYTTPRDALRGWMRSPATAPPSSARPSPTSASASSRTPRVTGGGCRISGPGPDRPPRQVTTVGQMTEARNVRHRFPLAAQLLVLGSLILCTLVAPGGAYGTTPPPTGHHVDSTDPTVRTPAQFRRAVVRLTNQARARHDVPRLRAKPCLKRVAQRWAGRMARRGQLVHNDLDNVQRACHREVGVGENIAVGYPSPRAVVRAWMRSDGHRANILRRSFDSIGVGAKRDSDGTWWWVQDFADMR